MFFFERSDLQIASHNGLFRKLVNEPDGDIQELVKRHRALETPVPEAAVAEDGSVAPSGA